MLIRTILFFSWGNFLGIILFGYGFAWIGHFGFERNKPLVLTYPLYSFYGDLKMFM